MRHQIQLAINNKPLIYYCYFWISRLIHDTCQHSTLPYCTVFYSSLIYTLVSYILPILYFIYCDYDIIYSSHIKVVHMYKYWYLRYEIGRHSKSLWLNWNKNLDLISKNQYNTIAANNRYDQVLSSLYSCCDEFWILHLFYYFYFMFYIIHRSFFFLLRIKSLIFCIIKFRAIIFETKKII